MIVDTPFNFVVPDTFKLLAFNIDVLDKLFKLLNIVVDVAFKLFIDRVEFMDKLFKLLNIVVDVAFKLFIDNIDDVDKLFKLLNIVVDVAFKLLIDNIVFGPMTDPPTFKVDKIVALLVVKLYELISYMPELFIILFIIY
jgi:hypothetical protein